MPRVDADVFSDREISRLYIGAALSESKRVEAVLTEHGIDYAVNVELFRSGIFSRPRHGAVFYVDAAQADHCRSLLLAAKLRRGIVEEGSHD